MGFITIFHYRLVGVFFQTPDSRKSKLANLYTPPKMNIEPEHDGWEDDRPLPGLYSQIPC